MADQTQRSRSVYIGNLPWDVKEDELKKIFSQVGTIVSLRMPVDPETQRSRGFAFCEYREQESVATAIKHFNGYEHNGRKIRVDSASNSSEKDGKATSGGYIQENEYGEPCEPVDTPEKIANVIGNFSPEQVHALLAETKRSLQEDPEEARRALVNNPQITYALLLALVRGRYISKERGTEALRKPEPSLVPLFPDNRPPPVPGFSNPVAALSPGGPRPPLVLPPGHMNGNAAPLQSFPPVVPHTQPPRAPFQNSPPVRPNDAPPHFDDHPRGGRNRPNRFEQNDRPSGSSRHDRMNSGRHSERNRPSSIRSPTNNGGATPPQNPPAATREEQEKAELIMQVLKLKEEDIAKMPPDQQRTVRTLREQFKGINK
ncbi:hypothetical protein RvY_12723 [Ramazzottius varieornatus]|uniref:RRM domain-containing protein n=1 Tax=Ramazzottius varieornatus TaxID=947166 RepID=A0A1D1VMH0_RAMVA|nr:hypothetical protein RvY_12723 [Ramazzottius varieornatus]